MPRALHESARREPVRACARGMALIVVLWAVAMAVLIVSSLQVAAFGQASAGRESLARTRAYWAARAGIEASIAKLEFATDNPATSDAISVLEDMEAVAEGDLIDAAYIVSHHDATGEVLGAEDLGAKLNLNRQGAEQLAAIEPFMLEDTISATLDWVDADDDANPLGAEMSYYRSLSSPYEPRNGVMRTTRELELVMGATADELRGEDWNLNGYLDPNEDDGDASWPPDNADGRLDAGWSGVLCAESLDLGLSATGQEMLDLKEASAGEVQTRAGVMSEQAEVIVRWAKERDGARMGDYLRYSLRQMEDLLNEDQQPRPPRSRLESLEAEQLGKLFDEAYVNEGVWGAGPVPGKLNINTCEQRTLEMIPNLDPGLVESLIAERDARARGFTSFAEIMEVPGIQRAEAAALYDVLTVKSNVYRIRSRGRDAITGVEVELVAVVDRSTLPVTIKGVRVQ